MNGLKPTASAAQLVAQAREAGVAWAALPVAQRAARLKEAGKHLLRHAEELAQILHEETHKPLGEAFSGDVLGVADLFSYWCSTGPKLLKPRRSTINPVTMPGKKAWVERAPRGVVAVISPWNYPVALPMRVIVPSLLAGNAVVFKPSEFTSRCGLFMVEKLAEVLGPVIAGLEGDGAAGAALIEAGPDLVHFTGSPATGKKVAVACAERGIAYEGELGGKDCAVVLADAAVRRTAAGIAWGIVHNAGQDCASVERVAVHEGIASAFLPALVQAMEQAAPQVPHLVTPSQREIVLAQLKDAEARGAQFLTGGLPEGDAPIPPTLISGLPRDGKAWREESFGPIAVVEVHATEEALVEAANDCIFGLGGSVWSKDLAAGERVARQLNTGMAWVNNHAFTGALPDLPWVGRGASGGGITSSPEMMFHLTRPRVLVLDKNGALEPWWYPYGETLTNLMRALITQQRDGGLGAVVGMLRAVLARNAVLNAKD